MKILVWLGLLACGRLWSTVLKCFHHPFTCLFVSSFTFPSRPSSVHHYKFNSKDVSRFGRSDKDQFVRTSSWLQEQSTVLYGVDNDSQDGDVVIVGGGFGGLNAALSLASMMEGDQEKKKRKIVLMDEKERFVFLPLLYELCIGDATVDEVAPTFDSLLPSNIEFVQARVMGIDVENHCLYYYDNSTADEQQSPIKKSYGGLIVASGSEMQLDAIPGAMQYALPFYTVEQCFELKRRFQLLEATSSSTPERNTKKVVIIGGGYSGVELALNTIQRFVNTNINVEVTLIHRGNEILENATPYNRQQGIDKLKEYGVTTLTNTNVLQLLSPEEKEEEDSDDTNIFACLIEMEAEGDTTQKMDADLVLWTAGATSGNRKTTNGILNSKLPRDTKGRIVTSNTLQVKNSPNVYAIGDCARTKKEPYAATAQVAMQQAPVASYNLYQALTSTAIQPIRFSYLDLGEMMTLGSNDATISSLQGLVQLNGPAASILRRLIYAVRMPTTQQSISALLSSTEQRIRSTTTDKTIQKLSSNDTKQQEKKKKKITNNKIMQWK